MSAHLAITEEAVLPLLRRKIKGEEVPDVVKHTGDEETALTTALSQLTCEIKTLQEKQSRPSTAAIVGVIGVALVIAAYIVNVSMYNASLAGEIKNQQTQIEFLKKESAETRQQNTEITKDLQRLSNLYMIQFGKDANTKGER